MKQVLHLAKKDLARHWLAALLVLVAIVLDALDTRFGLVSFSRLPDGYTFTLVKWPLCFLFTVALVQEDNTTGGRSHWLTRPIEPLALLGAKLLSVFAVVVAPQALASGLIASSIATPATEAALISAEALGLTFVLCLGTVLIAALTRSILHACVWIGALILIVIIGASVLQASFPELVKPSAAAVAAGGPSRVIAVLLFLTPSLIVTLCYHFRRRLLPISLALAAAIALGATVLALQWPWQLISVPPPSAPAPVKEYAPSKITFRQIGPVRLTGTRQGFDRTRRLSRPEQLVALPVSAESDRSDRVIGRMSATTTIHFADGTSRTFGPVSSWLFGARSPLQIAAGLGQPITAGPARAPARILNLFAYFENENPTPPTRPANATVKLSFDESEMRVVGRYRLVRGEHFQTADTWHEIASISRGTRSELRVHVRQIYPSSLLRPEPPRDPIRPLEVALFNRKLNEISIGHFSRSRSMNGPGAVAVGNIDFLFLARNGLGSAEETASELSPDWLADAELIVFRTEKVGQTEQTLHVENLFVAERELPVTRLVD